jgi:hypothetical protein
LNEHEEVIATELILTDDIKVSFDGTQFAFLHAFFLSSCLISSTRSSQTLVEWKKLSPQ